MKLFLVWGSRHCCVVMTDNPTDAVKKAKTANGILAGFPVSDWQRPFQTREVQLPLGWELRQNPALLKK